MIDALFNKYAKKKEPPLENNFIFDEEDDQMQNDYNNKCQDILKNVGVLFLENRGRELRDDKMHL